MMRSLVLRFVAVTGLAALGVFVPLPLRAQLVLPKEGETLPSFEVATIRASAEGGQIMRFQWGGDTCRIENFQLRSIIRQAYGATSDDQIVGGPDALMDEHLDLDAKADANDAEQMKKMTRDERSRESRLMLQSLLADRFHLKVHIETKVLPVYALVVAKGGPKLKASAPPPPPSPDADGTAPQSPPAPPSPDKPLPKQVPPGSMMMRGSSTKMELTASEGTINGLAKILANQPDAGGRQIIDQTGLTGKYDYHLEWAPADTAMGVKGADNGTGPDADAPPLFTALEEQLGLKLEPQKGPVQVVVIDHMEAPSAN
jgi:uncharacterized protein (TIGR03435 family)